MDAKISPSFWNDDTLATPALRLAALWLRTHAHINPVGYGEFSLRRFVFETGLPSEALAECFQALGRGCRSDERAYWLRTYIAENFGRGETLARNNFAKGFRRHIADANCPWLLDLIKEEYPELFPDSVFENKPFQGVGVVDQPQERRGEEKRRAERSGDQGVQGGKDQLVVAEEIYAAYPKHVGRKAALKAILAALRDHGAIELLGRTQDFAAAVASWPAEQQRFIPHPATWFNRGSFDDDPASWQASAPVGKNFANGSAALVPFDPSRPHAHTGGLPIVAP